MLKRLLQEKFGFVDVEDYKELKREQEHLLTKTLALKEELVANQDSQHKESLLFKEELARLKKESVIRTMSTKWSLIDKLDEFRLKDISVSCRICGQAKPIDSYKKLYSNCVFHGGVLERYECDNCGLIFGALKFLNLSDEEMAVEYKELYSVYSEGDSTEQEINTFYSLNPKKEGIYLNFGAGGWSHSIKALREEGWNVYGYEPYFDGAINDFTITSEEHLRTLKFDGVFSNNLIEHVKYPLDSFNLFKSLLKDETCRMAHSTPCYKYAFDYTRFHIHFFTGKSVDVLCDKTGLEVVDKQYDDAKDYINYVFMIKK